MSRTNGRVKPAREVAAVVTSKLADVSPSVTKTLAGIEKVSGGGVPASGAVRTPASRTTAPPAGAGWLRVTVACTESPAPMTFWLAATDCEKFAGVVLGTHITAWT